MRFKKHILTKLIGSRAQNGKGQTKHHKKFLCTGHEENQRNLQCGQFITCSSLSLRLTLITKVCKEYAILKDYEEDWPTHDVLKLHLKYTSEVSRRSLTVSMVKNIEKVHY